MPEDKNKPPADQPTAPPAPPAEEDSLDSSKAGPAPSTPSAPDQPAAPNTAKPPKKGLPGSHLLFGNLYLVGFVLLILAAGIVIYVSIKTNKAPSANNSVSSLTDQQLASLKGNTTLVGDSKSTLDVQSNSIFEGQVLLRSDLNVAGSLQIGKGLSIPSISVGGNGTFGDVGISGGLNVSKDTVLQGKLTVNNDLSVTGTASFGALDVSTLSVTSFNLRGDLSFNQHLVSSGGAPGRSGGTALGSGGTVSVSGSDTAGSINANTGSGPAAGCFATLSFSHSFSSTPYVVVSADNSEAATVQYYVTNRSASGFSLCTASVPPSGQNFVFNYVVIQ